MSTNEITKEKFGLQKLANRFDIRGRTNLIEDLLKLGSEESGMEALREGPRLYQETAEGLGWYQLEREDLETLYDAVFIKTGVKYPDSVEILEQLGWGYTQEAVAMGDGDEADRYTFTKGDIVYEFTVGVGFEGDEDDAAGLILESLNIKTGELCLLDYDGDAWKSLCEEQGIEVEPLDVYHYLEVEYELAKFLRGYGEHVVEVYGMHIWARTTTGQAATMDGCIEAAAKHFFADEWNGKDC